MEGNVMGGAILSASGAGVLELDPLLHHSPALHHHHQTLSHHLQGLAPLSTTQHLNVSQDSEQSFGLESKGTPKASLICNKGKSAGTSDEDEPSFTEEGDCHLGGKGKKGSPWQRMKWNDSMVRLLIHVVLLVGEDGTVDCADVNKRKSGILQKKGKWKSVSRVMNERGCYVSPQQCEDKFNDLNKRFKRLNDILGKGTARCIVDNPTILDTMDLSPKLKDDVKKILSSKHLFYKEMCSYHSGCKSLVSADFEFQPSIQAGVMGRGRDFMDIARSMRGENDMDEDEEDDMEEDDEEGNYDDPDDENAVDTQREAVCDLPSPFGKRRKSSIFSNEFSGSLSDYTKSIGLEPLNIELMSIMQDGTKLTVEQRRLIRTRAMQLEEQKASLLAQALELEKQRFKWQKFSRKKDRELERQRMDNKNMKLENGRMSDQLKQKELEMGGKRLEALMPPIYLILERLQSKEHIESGRGQGLG